MKSFLIATVLLVWAIPAHSSDKPAVLIYSGGPQHTGTYDTKPLDEKGDLKWKFNTVGDVTSPPLVHEGTVYFGDWKGYFYAVDTSTGQEEWRLNAGGAAAGPPTRSDVRRDIGTSKRIRSPRMRSRALRARGAIKPSPPGADRPGGRRGTRCCPPRV